MPASEDTANPRQTESWQRPDRAVKAFEDAWQHGGLPAIEDFLGDADPQRLELLRELVHVDIRDAGRPERPSRRKNTFDAFLNYARNRVLSGHDRGRKPLSPATRVRAAYAMRYVFQPRATRRFPN